MRYTKREQNYTGKERKLWELENDIEDGKLIYVNTIENLPRMQGKTLLEKAQKFDLLKEKIENGTLVELPCKIGDKVYIVAKPLVENEYKIYCRTINRIEVDNNNEIFYYFDWHTLSFQGDYRLTGLYYNKTWFTDRELAEKKLNELKKEEIQILCRQLFKIDEKLNFYYARMLDNEKHLIEALEKERESIKAKIKELHPRKAADYKDTSTPEDITGAWAEVEEYIR